jgi:RHS repeat-associated protein
LSSAAGSVAQTYTFDSFGNLAASSGSLTNRFQYTSREFDSETNLHYYRARYYDSNSGRFLTEDPIGFSGGFDFYLYVQNNPDTLFDPTGRKGIGPHLLDRARMLLSNEECAEFLKQLLVSLRLPPNLDDLLHTFDETQFLPTPKGDPFVKQHGRGFTAHVDDIGQDNVVHVDHPERDNAPVTLLHEVFHTINFGLSDYSLAHATGYNGSTTDMDAASNHFSAQMESHCKECKK